MPPKRLTSYLRDRLRFDVRDGGPIEGRPVVLLHGFPERASTWDAVAARLHGHGLRTLAPDQRGYSPGARPRTRWSYRTAELVEDVVALIGEFGQPVDLVGHDWGAAVAWRTAATYPDLVRTLTTIAVPHPAAYGRSLLTSSQPLRSWYALAFQPPFVVEAAVHAAPGLLTAPLRASGMDEDGVRRVETDFLAYGALPGALGWYRAAPLDAFASTPPVRVPTTHVWPTAEVALSERGARLTERYVEAPYELVVLDGVSHWAPSQAPDAVADVVVERVTGPGERRSGQGSRRSSAAWARSQR